MTTVAVSNESASWLGSSGENAGSPASEASTLCIWAVTRPRLPSLSRNGSGREAISPRASFHPSTAAGMNVWAIPSVALSACPS